MMAEWQGKWLQESSLGRPCNLISCALSYPNKRLTDMGFSVILIAELSQEVQQKQRVQVSPMSLNGHVLVLNQNYEPMTVCHVRKALVLVFLGKAEVIEIMEGKAIRSVYRSFPYPSIVRLSMMVHRQRKGILLSRKNVLKRDGFQCQYCGTHSHAMTVDHIIPKVRGGKDSWENMVTACIRCNNTKGDRTPEEADMTLMTKPRKPHHLSFIQKHVSTHDERWKPYLFMT